MGVYGSLVLTEDDNLDLSFLNEAYFGKLPRLLEMEEQIGKIRQNVSNFRDMNVDPEVLKLNRLFEEQFGVDVFAIHVAASNIENAWTIPIAKRYDIVFTKDNKLSNMIIADKKEGYRFKPNNGLCLVATITTGLLKRSDITDAEILAIILHEIGHNFADAMHNEIRAANKGQMVGMIIYQTIYLLFTKIEFIPISLAILGTNMIKNTNAVVSFKEKHKRNHVFGSKIAGLGNIVSTAGYTGLEFINRITFGLSNYLGKLLMFKGQYKNSPNKKNEVFADKFAGIYGYGPELGSGLAKMTNGTSDVQDFVEKIPVLGSMMNASYENSVKNFHEYDEHPHLIQRLNAEINVLESELKDFSIDPKMRKVIEDQIEELKKLKKELTVVLSDATKAEQIQAEYNAKVARSSSSGIDKKFEQEIEKIFDNVIEKKSK